MAEAAKRKVKVKRKFDPALFAGSVAKAIGEDRIFMGDAVGTGEPTGFLPSTLEDLNELLHREKKGWPLGCIVEVFGASQTCKTALGYEAIGQAQKQGGIGVLCPAEGAYDVWMAEVYNIDTKKLIIVDDDSGYFTVEGLFEAIYRLLEELESIEGTPPVVVVVDSIAGLITRADVVAIKKGEFDKSRSAQVRGLVLSQNLRRLGARIGRTSMLLFCINQVRAGGTTPTGVQGKTQPPGGYALGFYAFVRLRLEMQKKIDGQTNKKKHVKGFIIKMISEKNRLAHPFQEAQMVVHYTRGLLSASTYGGKKEEEPSEIEEPEEDFDLQECEIQTSPKKTIKKPTTTPKKRKPKATGK